MFIREPQYIVQISDIRGAIMYIPLFFSLLLTLAEGNVVSSPEGPFSIIKEKDKYNKNIIKKKGQ